MNNRVKEIRKQLNMNQSNFGKRIGVGQTTIAGYENGTRSLSDAIILSFCKEFDVNENWLRTGEGSMHKDLTRNDCIAKLFSNVLKDDDDSFRRRAVDALSALDESDWEFLAALANKIVNRKK